MARLVIAATPAEKFTIVPNDIIRRPDITPRAFRVFVWLIANTAGWETSADRIAQALDMSEGTVKKALIDLEQLGYLRRAQVHNADGTFSHVEYRLYFEPVVDATTGGQKVSDGTNPQVTTDGQKVSSGTTSGNTENTEVAPSYKKCPAVPTSGNEPNPQVTTDGHILTPLRRPTTKPKEDQSPQPPKGGGKDLAVIDNNTPKPRKQGKRRDYTPDFEAWWRLYPRRIQKATAFESWLRATHGPDAIDPETLNQHTARFAQYAALRIEPRFIPYPATWLNGARWEDELDLDPSRDTFTRDQLDNLTAGNGQHQPQGQLPW